MNIYHVVCYLCERTCSKQLVKLLLIVSCMGRRFFNANTLKSEMDELYKQIDHAYPNVLAHGMQELLNRNPPPSLASKRPPTYGKGAPSNRNLCQLSWNTLHILFSLGPPPLVKSASLYLMAIKEWWSVIKWCCKSILESIFLQLFNCRYFFEFS